MKAVLTFLTAVLLTTPALSHPGMGESAAHDTMHAIGGLEIVLAILAAGLVAWRLRGRLRSWLIRRK